MRANRATGRVQLIKCLWVYEHPVDMDAVQPFPSQLRVRVPAAASSARRCRSVATAGCPHSGRPRPLYVNTDPLPREQISDWADQWAQVPIDPETGPGWQMAVQSFSDGVTAICLVGSHCLGDGVAALLAVGTAAAGANIDITSSDLA